MDGAAIAAAIVAGLAAAHPPPPAPIPIVVGFARTPAQAQVDLLDYENNSAHAKIYTKATAALTTVFTVQKPNVTILLSELLVRAQSSAWAALFTMVIGGQALQFLSHYGRVTLAELKTHVNTFIDIVVGPPGRLAQNDYQLYLCLSASLDAHTKEVMTSNRSLCLAGVNDAVDSGLLFLKKLLMIAEADTRATTAHARDNLINLDNYMSQLPGSDIREFHTYVRRQYHTLTARGETTHDLVHHLFKGYDNAKCDEFKLFMQRKKDDFRDGTLDFTAESLMLVAENKFADLSVDKKWTAVSAQEQIILALRAQIAAKGDKRKPGPGNPARIEGGPQLPPAERFIGKMAWKAVPPKSGSPASKTVGKTNYHWCPHHEFWTVHKPSECTLATKMPATPSGSPAAALAAPRRPLTFAEAAAAIVENESESFTDQE
jgi:hypothetical protein